MKALNDIVFQLTSCILFSIITIKIIRVRTFLTSLFLCNFLFLCLRLARFAEIRSLD